MNLLDNIDHLSDLFIRPQRYIYRLSDLGARQFSVENTKVNRSDYKLKNSKGLTLECSLFSSCKLPELSKIIIYMHCNSGCRLEGLPYVRDSILAGFGLFIFDFAGSGNSEGKYVSLGTIIVTENKGFHEAKDIDTVVAFIRQSNPLVSICLWGRSMGAAATIKYLSEDSSIQLAILDSPFSSVRELAMELGKNRTSLPQLFVSLLLSYLKSIIKDRADFDIDNLNLAEIVKSIKVPAIFLSCEKDELVPFKQSENLFNLYSASKELLIIQQEHNEPRKKQTIHRVFKAIHKQMNKSIVLTEESIKKKQKIKKKLHLTHSHRELNMGRYSVPISDSCSILRLGSTSIKEVEKMPPLKSTIDLKTLPEIRIKREKISLDSRPLINQPLFKTKKVQSMHKSQCKNFPIPLTRSSQTLQNQRLLKSIDVLPHKPLALQDITYMKHRNTIHHLVTRESKEPLPRNTWIKRRKNIRPASNKQNLFH